MRKWNWRASERIRGSLIGGEEGRKGAEDGEAEEGKRVEGDGKASLGRSCCCCCE